MPYGLFFLIAVAYTAGAVTIAGRGALVQQVNAVESVANVTVVCTDETGTLTTGRLVLDEVVALTGDEVEARAALGALAGAASTPNLTTSALAAALPASPAWLVRDEVPFASVAVVVGRDDRGGWVDDRADPRRGVRRSPQERGGQRR